MKTLYFTITFSLIYFLGYTQNIINPDQKNISFETSEVLEYYQTESSSIIGYKNENYDILIQIKSSVGKSKNLSVSTKKTASSTGFTDITGGSTISGISNSYYVKGKGRNEDSKYPAYIILILDNEKLYHITIDCFNNNDKEGLKIINSFKLN